MSNSLRARLARRPILLAPGICDPLTALIASEAGAEALYLSGASIAYTRLGRPDIGLVSMTEVADVIAQVADRVATPLIVDADNGHGNALNMQRTMRLFERAGASALQIEDQSYPKRCGHLQEKKLIPAGEMVGEDPRGTGRTPQRGNAGDRPLPMPWPSRASTRRSSARCSMRRPAPTLSSSRLPAQPRSWPASLPALGRRLPLMANMVEGGRTPILPASALDAMGFSLVIFPGGAVRAMARAAQDFYRTLVQSGTSEAMRGSMLDFDGLNAVIGTPEMLALGKSYEAKD